MSQNNDTLSLNTAGPLNTKIALDYLFNHNKTILDYLNLMKRPSALIL